MSVGLILLAAGGSKRLGSPKQLVLFRGKTLLRHAAETALASRCRPVVVVLGAEAKRLRNELLGLEVKVVMNLEWEEGMASSIRAGLEALGEVEGVVLMVCDQPMVTAELIDRLAGDGRLAAGEYGGSVGVPAFFGREFFSELRALKGDVGAKRILEQHGATAIPFPDGLVDVDTVADSARLD